MVERGSELVSTDVRVVGVRSPVLTGGSAAGDAAVVFVHGNLGEGVDWAPLMAEVSPYGRCVAPDMPGFGAADKPADFDYTVDGYARHVGALLDELAIRRAHLVTHDLGGVWGLAWAARNPSALASMTLMSIGALPGYKWHRFARAYRTPLLGELVFATGTRRAAKWAMQYGSRHALPDDAVDRALRSSRDAGTRRAVLRFYRATPDLGAVTVGAADALRDANPPTLVVWGAGDPYVPVRFAPIQRTFFPRATVVELADCGHYPFLEDHAAVSAALLPFLRAQLGG
jgi:pimeloyl-ACP methyl ester carboxylesterase